MKKSVLIVLGIIEAALLLIAVSAVGINNRAISLEEQISGAEAQINVAEKRRVDLVYNLVDTVIAYQEYEGETMRAITEARASARSGDADSAMTVLNAVSEQYPDLKANENYRQLMTELALTENSIAQYRNSYNEQVRAYNKFIRRFPNSLILSILLTLHHSRHLPPAPLLLPRPPLRSPAPHPLHILLTQSVQRLQPLNIMCHARATSRPIPHLRRVRIPIQPPLRILQLPFRHRARPRQHTPRPQLRLTVRLPYLHSLNSIQPPPAHRHPQTCAPHPPPHIRHITHRNQSQPHIAIN